MLKQNLVANYFGQGWVSLMGLAFIPLYIQYLGIEAYGLIGIFAILQTCFSLLDMGMIPTLNREMARFTSGIYSAQYIRDFLRSVEVIIYGIAIVIVIGIWLASSYLASDWIKSETIPTSIVQETFIIMGFVVALRFIEGIYRSSIVGLQRQILFNVINSAMATFRGVGSLGVLICISPTVEAFFIWQGLVSVLTTIVFAFAVNKIIPLAQKGGQFSIHILRNIGKFAGGMMGITFLSLLLTQIDKVLLSKLLILTDYGYYAFALVVSSVIPLLISPISQAFFPRLSELYANNDQVAFIRVYHEGAQLVSVIAGSIAVVMIAFSEIILQLWTRDIELVHHTAMLVSLLTFGNILNGLMWIPYQAQLAHGWTRLAVIINIVSIMIVIPAILLVVPYYGAEGAAWVWIGLNTGYMLIGVQFMYRKILIQEKLKWYINDTVMPILAATLAVMFIIWITPKTLNSLEQIIVLAVSMCFTLIISIMMAPLVRFQLIMHLKKLFLKKSV